VKKRELRKNLDWYVERCAREIQDRLTCCHISAVLREELSCRDQQIRDLKDRTLVMEEQLANAAGELKVRWQQIDGLEGLL
jgi:hypothetical protein